MNTCTTALIVYRIWRVNQVNTEHLDMPGLGLIRVIRMSIESSTLNAAYILMQVILVQTGSLAIEMGLVTVC